MSCGPQVHGVIRHIRRTVADLHEFIAPSGLDLLDTLRQALKKSIRRPDKESGSILEATFLLVIRLPKTREPGGDVETVEARAFLTSSTLSTRSELVSASGG